LEFSKKKSDENKKKSCVITAGAVIAGSKHECKQEAEYGCLVMSDSKTNALYISVPRQALKGI
jgi:hypothetical protein